MASDEEVDRTARAADVARLFAQLAQERPAVLDALHALLSALCGPVNRCDAAGTTSSRQPARSVEAEQPPKPVPTSAGACVAESAATGICTPAPEPMAAPATMASVTTAPEQTEALPPKPTLPPAAASKPSREPRDETKAEASFQMLRSLFPDGFNTGAARGGLAAPAAVASRGTAALWEKDAAEARELAVFARAQARRLRSIRRARHEGRAIPQSGDVLAGHTIDDWLADPTLALALEPKDLREAERWYRTTVSALLEVADWLESHPDTPLGEGYTPDTLHQRLQCVATAQKGICTWFDDHVAGELPPGRQSCGVQFRIYQQLAHVWTKNFRTKLDHMRREQRVTNESRADVDRLLARFELESAPAEAKAAAAAPPATPAPTQPAHGERFDSVAEALDAAEADFGCGYLVFTDRARESAERSAFRRPDEAYAFFEALHAVAGTLASGNHGDPHDLLQARGFTSKPSHHLTMARHHRFYHMRFDGREVDLSQHVTLGSRNQNTCMSIHWWHDSAHGRFVIGHCGKHLPNTRT